MIQSISYTVETPNKGRLHFLRNVSNKGLLDVNSVQGVISGI